MAEFYLFATGHVPGQIDKSFSSYGLYGNALATGIDAPHGRKVSSIPNPTYQRRYWETTLKQAPMSVEPLNLAT